MANLRTSFPDLYLSRLAFLEKIIVDSMTTHPSMYPKLVNVEGMTTPFIKTTGISGFAQIPEIAEGGSTVFQDMLQGYDGTYTALGYSGGYKISKWAMDDDQDGVMRKAAKQLGFSASDTIETIVMNMFNNGFNSSYTGPDGLELFSTAHLLSGGGTEQNELTNAADLSVDTLQQALVDFADTVNNQNIITYTKPKVLLVPFELSFLAERLLGSEGLPGVANNDLNPLKSQGLTWLSSEYLTDSDAWFLLADKDNHSLYVWFKERPSVSSDKEFDTGTLKTKVEFRMVIGFPDWRGAFGSPGV